MPEADLAPADGQEIHFRWEGEEWLISWHPPDTPPAGTPHGAAGVCLTPDGEVVLISEDGLRWGLPAGRPEGAETWEQTLRREVLEEACATVGDTRLLGFQREACLRGPQAGRVLVRSVWRAEVVLGPWEPLFEIVARRLVAPGDVLGQLPGSTDGYRAMVARALREAGALA